VSRNLSGFISCPPFVIAYAASRVPPGLLDLPGGYDQDMLERIRGLTGFPERDVQVTVKQAQELAQIGAQLLKLHSEGVVDLGYFEKQSVIRLVDLVTGHAGDGDTR
jgi:hypothetical protein